MATRITRTTRHATTLVQTRPFIRNTIRNYSSSKPNNNNNDLDINQLLSTPTWSISSLLPESSSSSSNTTPKITSTQLHHLLRLSALPPPTSAASEQRMLDTLSSQLHFVQDVQKINTEGVEPLKSLRDETAQGEEEAELGLEALKGALGLEEVRGRWFRRVRRRERMMMVGGKEEAEGEEWDVLGTAQKRVGRYFVVEGGKEG